MYHSESPTFSHRPPTATTLLHDSWQPDPTRSKRWVFSLSSDRLFVLGSTEATRRTVYRTAEGEIRFLPK